MTNLGSLELIRTQCVCIQFTEKDHFHHTFTDPRIGPDENITCFYIVLQGLQIVQNKGILDFLAAISHTQKAPNQLWVCFFQFQRDEGKHLAFEEIEQFFKI